MVVNLRFTLEDKVKELHESCRSDILFTHLMQSIQKTTFFSRLGQADLKLLYLLAQLSDHLYVQWNLLLLVPDSQDKLLSLHLLLKCLFKLFLGMTKLKFSFLTVKGNLAALALILQQSLFMQLTHFNKFFLQLIDLILCIALGIFLICLSHIGLLFSEFIHIFEVISCLFHFLLLFQ